MDSNLVDLYDSLPEVGESQGRDALTAPLEYGQLQMLFHLTETLSTSSDLQEIYDKALSGLGDVLALDRVSLLTLDDKNVMRFRAWRNLSKSYRQTAEGHSPWSPDEPDPQPVLVGDVKSDPSLSGFQELFEQEGVRALAFIPLQHRNQLIGKLMLYYRQPHNFSPVEIQLAQKAASRIAVAIERTRSRESLMNYAHQQSGIARLGQQALKGLDLSRLMDQVVHQVSQTLGLEMCKLLELQPDGDQLRLVAGVGWQEGLVGRATIDADQHSQAAYTLEQQEPVIITDLGHETRFKPSALLLNHNAVSGMSVVVEGTLGPYGILEGYTTYFRRFTQDEVNFLHSMANTLAAAIQRKQSEQALEAAHASLEEQIENRTALLKRQIDRRKQAEMALKGESEYIRLMLEVAGAANGADSIQEAFRFALDKICNFTGWPLGHVYIQASELLADGPKDKLISSDIWRCPDDEEFHLFQKITSETQIEKDSGWLGKVFQTGEPAWITDLPADKEYRRHSGLQGVNIRSGIAFPIFIGDEVAAVMEFYSPNFQQPDPALLTVMAHIGTQLGRIIERDQAKRKILRAEKRLRELAARLVKTQEDERKRIAHELHDGVGQSMIALQMSLNMLASELEGHSLIEELDQARKVTRQIVEGMQELAYELRPPELEIMGLDAALQDACQNFAKKAVFGIHYRGTRELPVNISDIIQLSFYRALQEALANIAQHAEATQVNVQFSYEDGQISLLVADNGKGLPEPAKVVSGLGLIELTERFVRLGGSLRIGSQENNGTTLTVTVPWEAQEFS